MTISAFLGIDVETNVFQGWDDATEILTDGVCVFSYSDIVASSRYDKLTDDLTDLAMASTASANRSGL